MHKEEGTLIYKHKNWRYEDRKDQMGLLFNLSTSSNALWITTKDLQDLQEFLAALLPQRPKSKIVDALGTKGVESVINLLEFALNSLLKANLLPTRINIVDLQNATSYLKESLK